MLKIQSQAQDAGTANRERPRFGALAQMMADVPKEAVDDGLEQQRLHGGRLGEILMQRGFLSRSQVSAILHAQAEWTAREMERVDPAITFPYPAFLSVCFPAYNEQDNIEDTLEAALAILPAFVADFEVVVVDDGSRDRTGEIVGRRSELDIRVRLMSHSANRGYGAAVTTGLRAARGELLAFLDADGQLSLLDLPRFLSLLEGGDAVIGYRHRRADSWRRRLMARGWNWLVGLVLGVWVRDVDCAFKLFRRQVIDRLRLTATSPAINAEMLVQCQRGGATFRETPVCHYPRYHGKAAGCNLRMIARAFRELPRLLGYRFFSRSWLATSPAQPALAVNTALNGQAKAYRPRALAESESIRLP